MVHHLSVLLLQRKVRKHLAACITLNLAQWDPLPLFRRCFSVYHSVLSINDLQRVEEVRPTLRAQVARKTLLVLVWLFPSIFLLSLKPQPPSRHLIPVRLAGASTRHTQSFRENRTWLPLDLCEEHSPPQNSRCTLLVKTTLHLGAQDHQAVTISRLVRRSFPHLPFGLSAFVVIYHISFPPCSPDTHQHVPSTSDHGALPPSISMLLFPFCRCLCLLS